MPFFLKQNNLWILEMKSHMSLLHFHLDALWKNRCGGKLAVLLLLSDPVTGSNIMVLNLESWPLMIKKSQKSCRFLMGIVFLIVLILKFLIFISQFPCI